ncbi:MAG: peptidylprolyl isomerase [Planctomycetota bacterium]
MKICTCMKIEILLCCAMLAAPFVSVADAEPNKVAADANTITPAGKDIAVTVNGIDVNEGDVQREVARQLAGSKIPPQFIGGFREQVRKQVIDKMIGQLLVDERIKEEVLVTENEVIDFIKKIGAAQRPPLLSLEQIKKAIETGPQSFEQVKENVRRRLGYQRLMEPKWAGKVDVTEDDARKYYDENLRLFESPEQVRASHILIKPDTSDPNRDPNEAKAEAKAKAEQLRQMIMDGNDFATLARKHSGCSSARQGGDLGFETRRAWVKPFSDAAFSLKVGQVSGVVETRFGYHIIRTTARRAPSTVAFEQAKDRIISELSRSKRDEIAKEYVASLKDSANIVYPPGKEPKVSKPRVVTPPKPAPVDSNTPAEPPEDANAVQGLGEDVESVGRKGAEAVNKK